MLAETPRKSGVRIRATNPLVDNRCNGRFKATASRHASCLGRMLIFRLVMHTASLPTNTRAHAQPLAWIHLALSSSPLTAQPATH
jgi:hypothetical protein